jgi:ATP-dependent DNA helicase DinG
LTQLPVLSDALKQDIQRNYSLLLKGKQLQTRAGQKLMIADIARTLTSVDCDEDGRRSAAEPGVCVVEAGTGTGKTLAYLVAAVPVAKALDKKLIISTATVALQEQVLNKERAAIQLRARQGPRALSLPCQARQCPARQCQQCSHA